mgnify:CR=1 FL=1
MDIRQFEARKREHIQHALNSAHQAMGLTGLEHIHLHHDALPELNFGEIQLVSPCLGKAFQTPFYIAGMTAGHEDAAQINRILALACQERGWAMGVGSQRRDLEMREGGLLDQWKALRKEVPRLTLFANIGLSQLIPARMGDVQRLVEDIEAQALVVHTNALQEVLQWEGTPSFRDGLKTLQRYCREFSLPVVLKETGCGFSEQTLLRLSDCGLGAIDVSGLGGTHWGRIEGARAEARSVQALAAQTFAQWGEPTVESVRHAAAVLPKMEIWASGGVRSGLDAAKLIALGAHRIGYAKPALDAALVGIENLNLWMQTQEYELKIALFCTGSQSPEILRQKDGSWTCR